MMEVVYVFVMFVANFFLSFFLKTLEMQQWQTDYMRGTGMEMYTEYLSSAFNALTFPEAAE